MKIIHLITSLDTGGAEMMLYKLLSRLNRDEFKSEVVSLLEEDMIGKKIQELGIPIRALRMRRGVPDPRYLFHLATCFRQERPDLILSWMYHADLMAALASRVAENPPVIWNIRNTNLDPRFAKRMTIWTAKTCARLSRFLPSRILCGSESARRAHVDLGYCKTKMTVIPNGFDLEKFHPDSDARASVRREIGVQPETLLVGLPARFDPLKDHENFVNAAAALAQTLTGAYFLLCGGGIDGNNQKLVEWIHRTGFQNRFRLLGPRQDMPRLVAALDIAALSSIGEGFPNVIGEAMACGVPCVATDVGDCSLIIGDTGRIVPPKDPEALAKAWGELLKMEPEERRQLGLRARQRIMDHYSLDAVARKYEALFREGVFG